MCHVSEGRTDSETWCLFGHVDETEIPPTEGARVSKLVPESKLLCECQGDPGGTGSGEGAAVRLLSRAPETRGLSLTPGHLRDGPSELIQKTPGLQRTVCDCG